MTPFSKYLNILFLYISVKKVYCFRKGDTAKHSLSAKRRQRLSRNKRKREERRQLKRGLYTTIAELKEDKECLTQNIKFQSQYKEKYFKMWQQSEKEKEKLKNSRATLQGHSIKHSGDSSPEILQIQPTMLEDVSVKYNTLLGKGRFGTVSLKNFRKSPVAVKCFDSSSSVKMIEREAMYLRQCCHLNLPLLYGMNTSVQPYFIVTQFYGISSLEAITLNNVIKETTSIRIKGVEHWMHVIHQLSDCLLYLHNKSILHNDIKSDNIVVVQTTSNGIFFSPILIDFGKAHLISEGRKRNFSEATKAQYYKEHVHIAPEIVECTQPPSVKSNVYSVGVVVARIYNYCKSKSLKEIAKKCLRAFSDRCTSAQLLELTKCQ